MAASVAAAAAYPSKSPYDPNTSLYDPNEPLVILSNAYTGGWGPLTDKSQHAGFAMIGRDSCIHADWNCWSAEQEYLVITKL